MTLHVVNRGAKPFNVLFLCTHNSARSILAEGLATKLGNGRLIGHSAGSRPGGVVNPHALEILRERGCRVTDLRSKSWDEYACPGAAPLDLVITVCDNAARESCPVWPGTPATANWACRDPSAVAEGEQATALAFRHTADLIACRLERLLEVPLDILSPAMLAEQVNAIARDVPESVPESVFLLAPA